MIAAKRASGNLSLRIWSAGCAQGQEIYTLALLLLELIPDIYKWHIHLLGTDINNDVLTKAVHGRFTEWSFRATPNTLRERWFTRVGHEYEIHPQIRRMVRFAYLNLTADDYPAILNETNALDLILCRNVFIYLDEQVVQRSMARYAHCLVDQGVLLLGASDPIHYQHTELELVQNSSTGYFRKVSGFNTLLLSYQPYMPALPAQKLATSPTAMPLAKKSQAVAHEPQDMTTIAKLLNDSDWNGALEHVDAALLSGAESSDLWQIKAKVLANTGNLDLALQACERSLKLDSVNKHSYFLMGLILAELDRLQEAAEALRKTLYLDHAFLEAHYEMGMLRVRAKDMPSAFKSLENALKLAKKGNPAYPLHHAAGMTYGRFAQVLENELAILRGV